MVDSNSIFIMRFKNLENSFVAIQTHIDNEFELKTDMYVEKLYCHNEF